MVKTFLNKISFFSITIGLLGFFVSLYALALHLRQLLQPGHGFICDVNATISCSDVIGSMYGEVASIPLGAYGMSYFILILVAACMPKIATLNKKWLASLELVIALTGFFSVLALMYISYSILQLVCPTCSIIHVLIILYTISKLINFIKVYKEPYSAQNGTLVRFFAVSLCLAIPPLAVGLIAPIIIMKFFAG